MSSFINIGALEEKSEKTLVDTKHLERSSKALGCWALVTLMATITQRNQYIRLNPSHDVVTNYYLLSIFIIGGLILALSGLTIAFALCINTSSKGDPYSQESMMKSVQNMSWCTPTLSIALTVILAF